MTSIALAVFILRHFLGVHDESVIALIRHSKNLLSIAIYKLILAI